MKSLLSRARGLLPANSFARGVAVLAGGTAFSQALTALAAPFITRFYSPQQFGTLAVYISMLSLLTVTGSFSYEQTIPLPKEDRKAADLMALSFLLLVVNSVLNGTVVSLFGEKIAGLVQTPELAHVLWLLPFSMLAAGIYVILNGWALRRKAYADLAKTKFSQSIGMTGVQISGGLAGAGIWGLVIGDVVGRASGSLRLAAAMIGQERENLRLITWKGMREVAVRYKRFPLISCGSTLMNNLTLQIPAFLLAAFYGAHAVGLYALAQRVVGLPFQVIGHSVGEVFMSESAKAAQASPETVSRLFWNTVKHLFYIAFPMSVLLILLAPWGFTHIFGKSWAEAGTYLQFMAVMFFFQLLASPVSGAIYVTERQELHFYREIIRLSLIVGALLLAKGLNQPAVSAVLFLSVGGALGYAVVGLFSWVAVRRFRPAGDGDAENGEHVTSHIRGSDEIGS